MSDRHRVGVLQSRRAPVFDGAGRAGERGSALVLALFVLFILGSMGISLLFLARTEVRTSQADVRSKVAFYLAESGLEQGRGDLFDLIKNTSFDPALAAAAGSNGVIDFDASQVRLTRDGQGRATGLTGFGDDVPLRPLTQLGDGWYAAFLTNDPLEGRATTVDMNLSVEIAAIGSGPDRSTELVRAIIEQRPLLPTTPPAAITLMGPAPSFNSGVSNAKDYVGDDCGGSGEPGLSVPIVGTIGGGPEAEAETGIERPEQFTSGGQTGADTVADLTDPTEPTVITGLGTIDSQWIDCQGIHEMVEDIRYASDVVCYEGQTCTPPVFTSNSVWFHDGDLVINQALAGEGVLLVTGEFIMDGRASWDGIVLVIGEGRFIRDGAGNGTISGAMVVADIAGPDSVYGTDDDCTGGTDGFGSVLWDESGGGNGDLTYCSEDIVEANPVRPYVISDFRQQ